MTCLYTNADQLMNKRQELLAAIDIYNPGIIGITEVKPKSSRYVVQESELSIDGYDIFHNLDQTGRGLVLYVRCNLKPSLVDTIVNSFSEKLFVECSLKDGSKLLIGLIYRWQDDPVSVESAKKLCDLFVTIDKLKYEHKLLMGDFNFPQINWVNETCNASAEHISSKFLQVIKDTYWIQHQITPTRYRLGQKANTLDLVFTNEESLIVDLKVEAGLGKSDHMCLVMELSLSADEILRAPRRNFKKMNCDKLRSELGKYDWDNDLENKDVNESWNLMKDRITCAIEASTPLTKNSSSRKKRYMDNEATEAVKNKHCLYRRWQRTRDPERWNQYKKANNKARRCCRKAQRNFEQNVAKQSKTNPKMFYGYANSKIKCRTGIADLNKEDGSTARSDKEKAELLNQFFQSVFTIEGTGDLPDFDPYEYDTGLNDFEIEEETVKKTLQGLKMNKAAGPDGIPPSVLCEAADQLARPITLLFRKSLNDSCVPEEWKMAHVSPIFKKGSKASVNNYRPVSLTCILCKVLEKLVRHQVMNRLNNNNLISRHQHGLVPGRHAPHNC